MIVLERGRIPARQGQAARLLEGQNIRVINTHGQQVVDTWAFAQSDVNEFMSMEHTRAGIRRLSPRVGDALLSNRRRPILTVIEDTSPGVHDTLIAACDIFRYRGLGVEGHHDNCTENLHAALQRIGVSAAKTPCPLNLFMNIPWTEAGVLDFREPPCRPGDSITLRAGMDCIVVFSACPQDLIPINGINCKPTDAHFEILGRD
jgi:uncharacterized protein YcgI (DUF1989 family)